MTGPRGLDCFYTGFSPYCRVRSPTGARHRSEALLDFVYIVLGCALFGVAVLYDFACDRL